MFLLLVISTSHPVVVGIVLAPGVYGYAIGVQKDWIVVVVVDDGVVIEMNLHRRKLNRLGNY